MSRSKYPASLKINIAKAYLNGEGSYHTLALKYNVSNKAVRNWVALYRVYGELAFSQKTNNSTYTSEFKINCVNKVLSGEKTISETVAEYNISSDFILRNWIKSYNANRTLKDYTPNKEVYMAEAKRKTTLTERLEIVEYCLKHGQDYKNTASIYDVSYNQVYSWVKKYNKSGENALIDNRGHHKTDDEVDELEKLRRENVRLKKRLKEKERLTELLKKAREFERM